MLYKASPTPGLGANLRNVFKDLRLAFTAIRLQITTHEVMEEQNAATALLDSYLEAMRQYDSMRALMQQGGQRLPRLYETFAKTWPQLLGLPEIREIQDLVEDYDILNGARRKLSIDFNADMRAVEELRDSNYPQIAQEAGELLEHASEMVILRQRIESALEAADGNRSAQERLTSWKDCLPGRAST